MSGGEGFLARWSRRKREAAVGEVPPAEAPNADVASAASAAPVGVTPTVTPAQPAGPSLDRGDDTHPAPLPAVESLTADSDFAPFMAQDVDPALRRAALKTLFQDERFNVMDGLDVYIDDYTKPSPIPPEWYGRMEQLARLGDYAAKEARDVEAQAAANAAAQAAANNEAQAATNNEAQAATNNEAAAQAANDEAQPIAPHTRASEATPAPEPGAPSAIETQAPDPSITAGSAPAESATERGGRP